MINEENNGSQPELDISLGDTVPEQGPEYYASPEIPAENPEAPAASRKPGVFSSDWFFMAALYVITLVIHVLMTQVTTMFNLTPDEYAVTGVAAWANGLDWSATVSAGGYYGYFQSLFYIPVLKLFSDPMTQYRAMIILNGFIMSFAPVIVYYLSRKWFNVRKLSSVFISVVCGMYPSYFLLTKYTWNETMCCILPWVFALLMYKSLRSHKDAPHTAKAVFMQQLWAVLAGLTIIAAYASHGRMLALTAAGVVLELIVLITMKRRLFSLVGFFTSCAGGFVIDKFLKHYIQAELWLSGTKEKASVNTIENMFSRISNIDAEKLEHFPQTLFGHFFYFISSTWGFGAVCIVLIFSGIVMYYVSRRRIRNSDEAPVTAEGKPQTYIGTSLAIFCWYALLAMGAIFVVSVAFKATSSVYDTRADTAIFGRYIETFFPIAIFPALIMIYRRRFTAKHCFGALLVAAFVFVMTEMFTVSAVVGDGSTTKNIVGAMILGIAPLRIGEGLKDTITETTFLKIIGVVMLLLLALVIARLIKKKGESLFNIVTIPLGALLIYTTLYGFDNYTVVQGKNAQYGANYVTQALSMIDDCPYNDVLCFSMKGERYSKAQFLFPEMKIRLASNTKKLKELETCPDFILCDREDNLNMWIDDIYLVGDINNNVQLYACSENAINWAQAAGLEMTGSGAMTYTGENIPGTSSVTRSGHTAMLPEGSAVYTNYFLLYNKGKYTATVKGSGLTDLSVALTSDKKANDMPYEIISNTGSELTLTFSVTDKTENVQLKLTNKNGGSAVSVDELSVAMSSYTIKEYSGDSLVLGDGCTTYGTSAVVPYGSEISSLNLIMHNAEKLQFQIKGDNLNVIDLTLTSNGKELDGLVETFSNYVTITFDLPEPTEDLKLTIRNNSSKDASIYTLAIRRMSGQKLAVLPKVSGVNISVS